VCAGSRPHESRTSAHSLHHTMHHTAPHCTMLHHTAPRCTTLHHTAPHCNTLHHYCTCTCSHSACAWHTEGLSNGPAVLFRMACSCVGVQRHTKAASGQASAVYVCGPRLGRASLVSPSGLIGCRETLECAVRSQGALTCVQSPCFKHEHTSFNYKNRAHWLLSCVVSSSWAPSFVKKRRRTVNERSLVC